MFAVCVQGHDGMHAVRETKLHSFLSADHGPSGLKGASLYHDQNHLSMFSPGLSLLKLSYVRTTLKLFWSLLWAAVCKVDVHTYVHVASCESFSQVFNTHERLLKTYHCFVMQE